MQLSHSPSITAAPDILSAEQLQSYLLYLITKKKLA